MATAGFQLQEQKLVDLRPLEKAQVCAVSAGAEDAARLTGLGVCLGRMLTMVRSGDPMIVKVYGSRIALSARIAKMIGVVLKKD